MYRGWQITAVTQTHLYCEDDCHIFFLQIFFANAPKISHGLYIIFYAFDFNVSQHLDCRTQLSLTLQTHTTALDSATIEWRICIEQSLEDSVLSTFFFLNTVCCVYSPPDKTLGLPCPVYLSGLVASRNISRESLEPPTLRIRSIATYTVHVDGWAVRQKRTGRPVKDMLTRYVSSDSVGDSKCGFGYMLLVWWW